MEALARKRKKIMKGNVKGMVEKTEQNRESEDKDVYKHWKRAKTRLIPGNETPMQSMTMLQCVCLNK